MHSFQKQKGMTGIGWLIVLGLIAFFTVTALRLIPLYLEYSKVATVLESLSDESGLSTKPMGEIIRLIDKRLYINDVRGVRGSDAKITKEDGVLKIQMKYERREHFLGNIDIVGKFDKEVRVRGN